MSAQGATFTLTTIVRSDAAIALFNRRWWSWLAYGRFAARVSRLFEDTAGRGVEDPRSDVANVSLIVLEKFVPLWAALVACPAYRKKNKKVNTYIERIQGCFAYSMNAPASVAVGAPAADSDTIVSLVAYSFWLATGAPTGDVTMPGRGYPPLNETDQGFDPERGAAISSSPPSAPCATARTVPG